VVAVGGVSATSFINPIMGFLMEFGVGIFLLLDPNEILEMEDTEDGDGV